VTIVITLYCCIFFIPHHLFDLFLKFHIISKIIKVLVRLYSVRLVWVHTYLGVFMYVCVCAFSGNCQAPCVGLWFIYFFFGIHCLLGCLCFHTYYTLCLCLVFSIFLYNISLYNARCFLCHVLHCAPGDHTINILGMMGGGHCTCNMVTAHRTMFWTQYMLRTLMYWVLSD